MKYIAAFLIFLFAFPAFSQERPAPEPQQRCGSHDEIKAKLKGFRQSLYGYGIDENKNAMIELYANEERGYFTVVVTNAQGRSCVVFWGQNWRRDFENYFEV